jgi:hypothetical protein
MGCGTEFYAEKRTKCMPLEEIEVSFPGSSSNNLIPILTVQTVYEINLCEYVN